MIDAALCPKACVRGYCPAGKSTWYADLFIPFLLIFNGLGILFAFTVSVTPVVAGSSTFSILSSITRFCHQAGEATAAACPAAAIRVILLEAHALCRVDVSATWDTLGAIAKLVTISPVLKLSLLIHDSYRNYRGPVYQVLIHVIACPSC